MIYISKESVFICNGATNHSLGEREINDYYATEPKAVELLLEEESFSHYILEPCCGAGHISQVLKQHGYNVQSSDIVYRGYPGTEIKDFFSITNNEDSRDIVTNPPYKYAQQFVQHALDISPDGTKIAMFLKLTFLESQSRKELFLQNPFKTLYVSSSRLNCAKNGDFETYGKNSSAIAYGWYVWEKGYQGDPVIKWIN